MRAFVILQDSGRSIRKNTAGDRDVFDTVAKITKQVSHNES